MNVMYWLGILGPAWAAGAILACLSAPLGCLMLWRRMAFFADTLAHGSLLGVALAAVWGLPLWVGVLGLAGVIVAVLWVMHDKRLPMDAVLAFCASSLLCGGLLIINQLPQLRAQLLGYLFGDLMALEWQNIPMLLGLTVLGCLILYKTWRAQLRLAIHADIAITEGVKAGLQRLLFMALLALFTLLALRIVGTLLMGALLVIPALTARLLAQSPKQMVIIACVLAQLGLSAGLWGSVWLDVSSGPAIVLTMSLGFMMVWGSQRVLKSNSLFL